MLVVADGLLILQFVTESSGSNGQDNNDELHCKPMSSFSNAVKRRATDAETLTSFRNNIVEATLQSLRQLLFGTYNESGVITAPHI